MAWRHLPFIDRLSFAYFRWKAGSAKPFVPRSLGETEQVPVRPAASLRHPAVGAPRLQAFALPRLKGWGQRTLAATRPGLAYTTG
jgi:hypothetical protein